MSRTVTAASRLVRLREVQSRLATAKFAQAHAESTNLSSISARIEGLRLALGFDAGMTSGTAFRAMTEMSLRLDGAKRGLITPMAQADDLCAHLQTASLIAKDREDRAAKKHAEAIASAVSARETRADANRAYRKPKSMIGEPA
jgi:hypothetical protein